MDIMQAGVIQLHYIELAIAIVQLAIGLDVHIVKAAILHTKSGFEHQIIVALLIVQVKELEKEVVEENMQIVILLVLIAILIVVGVQMVQLPLIA